MRVRNQSTCLENCSGACKSRWCILYVVHDRLRKCDAKDPRAKDAEENAQCHLANGGATTVPPDAILDEELNDDNAREDEDEECGQWANHGDDVADVGDENGE